MVEKDKCRTSRQGERKAAEMAWQRKPQRTREIGEIKEKENKTPPEPLKEFASYTVYSWLHDELAEQLEKVDWAPQHRQFVNGEGVCVG